MDDTTRNDENVVEGQIEEETPDMSGIPTEIQDEPQSAAELVVSLTNLINANLKEIKGIEEEMAKHKEMVTTVLDNDATYKQHAEAAKEASRIKTKPIFYRRNFYRLAGSTKGIL